MVMTFLRDGVAPDGALMQPLSVLNRRLCGAAATLGQKVVAYAGTRR
jgi:hypothetical protein